MGQADNATRVDFAAYCRAFETIQGRDAWSSICAALDPAEGRTSVDFLHRGDAGDGYIYAPEYGFVRGRGQEIATRWFRESGNVIRVEGEYERTVVVADDELARYFIAGAFGTGELKDTSGLDQSIINGLQKLYPLCLKDEQGCLESAPAKKIASAWQEILKGREKEAAAKKEFENAKLEIVKLQQEFERLGAKAVNRESLLVGVAPYKSRMPASVSTIGDCEATKRLLEEMIAVAQAVVAGDEQRAEEKDKQSRLATYRAENSGMRSRINTAERHYWRFTNAYDEGMKCMPTPRNAEEEYCVEKNKFDMGQWLMTAAQWHPQRSDCDKYETQRESYEAGDGRTRWKDVSVCVRSHLVGQDTSEKDAVSKARSYCSTQCR